MGVGKWVIFCAGLLLLAVVFSYPLVFHLRNGMPYSFMPVPGLELQRQYPGDYIQLVYRFWLFGQALAGETPCFSNAYEFSTPLTPPMFSMQGIPLSCLFLIFTPWGTIFAYNMLILLSFLAAGMAMALLVREVTRSLGAGAICGFLYACVPNRLGHLYGGHMGGFVYFLVPLGLYCLEKSWREGVEAFGGRGGKSIWWGFAFGLCALCTAVTELHFSFYSAVLLVLYVSCRCIELWARNGFRTAMRAMRPPLAGLALPIALAAGYLLWVKLHIIGPSVMGGGRTLRTVQAFSPTLKDIFSKNANAERNIYLGFPPIIVALYGVWARRREIRDGRAERGALLWLYFWLVLFAACYLMSLGMTLERYFPFYSRLHAKVPFLAYSRTSSRIVCLALTPFLLLCGYGVKDLLSRGRMVRTGVWLIFALALVDYHPRGRIGISTLRGMDAVYEEVRREARGKRVLELPIWPGDSALSTIYEYYATLTAVPIVNGYNPAPPRGYFENVFEPLRNLNYGEMRQCQYDVLRRWGVPCVVLHQDLFPRRVSRYPFRFTLLNLMRSPYLQFVRSDGPHYLFRVRNRASGPEGGFTLTSPVANLYPAMRMKGDVGACIHDGSAASGSLLSAGAHGEKSGILVRGDGRIYPTGEFKVFFRLNSDQAGPTVPVAGIDVYAPDKGTVIAERALTARDFGASGGYRLFELRFANREPRSVEFRVHYLGRGILQCDFIYVIFAGEDDPCRLYEAEDLFHIGPCVDDPAASGGHAVKIGRDEDLTMPMVSGPDRLYGKGRYRALFYLRVEEAEGGTVAKIEVASTFGGLIACREVKSEELADSRLYRACSISFELDRPTPLSFILWHYNRACLRLDRIEVEKIELH